jgi:glyoxylase-like metal-dependent hydrolase (beta-lactamase superfamily II)
MIIWNVAHGLAVTLITPNQRLIAYDAGRSEDLSPLTELERAGWSQLDYFFLSHPHADHLRDIDALIRMHGGSPPCPPTTVCEDAENLGVRAHSRPRQMRLRLVSWHGDLARRPL